MGQRLSAAARLAPVFARYLDIRKLIAAARELGEDATVRLCEELLKEEEEMGRWLLRHLPRLVEASSRAAARVG